MKEEKNKNEFSIIVIALALLLLFVMALIWHSLNRQRQIKSLSEQVESLTETVEEHNEILGKMYYVDMLVVAYLQNDITRAELIEVLENIEDMQEHIKLILAALELVKGTG